MWIHNNPSPAFTTNITAGFYTELENNPAPSWLALVFRIILSSIQTEIISFSKGFPGMREWLGERRVQSLSQYQVSITKKNHELTVGIGYDDIYFDKWNNITDHIRGLAQAVPRHFVDYFVSLMLGGFSTPSYDGQYYFDSDHPNGVDANGAAETISNTTAAALDATSYAVAQMQASKWRNADTQKPLNVKYTHLFYAPGAKTAELQLFGAERLASGATNVYFDNIPKANRIEVQEFGNTAKWFLLDLAKIMKPLLLQIVKGMDFIPFDKPTDWNVFSERQYVYGIDTMDNATYLLPELAYGSSVA
jgi:phage major head subunit gpT-like protein